MQKKQKICQKDLSRSQCRSRSASNGRGASIVPIAGGALRIDQIVSASALAATALLASIASSRRLVFDDGSKEDRKKWKADLAQQPQYTLRCVLKALTYFDAE